MNCKENTFSKNEDMERKRDIPASILSTPNAFTESLYRSGVAYMQKHATMRAERNRSNRFSFLSLFSASLIVVATMGFFLVFFSNVSCSSSSSRCWWPRRDDDNSNEEEEEEEEAIALDIGRDISFLFYMRYSNLSTTNTHAAPFFFCVWGKELEFVNSWVFPRPSSSSSSFLIERESNNYF